MTARVVIPCHLLSDYGGHSAFSAKSRMYVASLQCFLLGCCCTCPLSPSFQGLPPLQSLDDVCVEGGDELEPLGSVLSAVEGMVVVQGRPHARALADG